MGSWLAFMFNPNGRASRRDMWLKFYFPVLVLLLGAGAADQYASIDLTDTLGPAGVAPLSILVLCLLIWPSMAVQIKRAHDLGWSGWWAVVLVLAQLASLVAMVAPFLSDYRWATVFDFIPLPVFFGIAVWLTASFYQFVYFYCVAGQDFTNRFGPDPRDPAAALPNRESVRIFD